MDAFPNCAKHFHAAREIQKFVESEFLPAALAGGRDDVKCDPPAPPLLAAPAPSTVSNPAKPKYIATASKGG
jgi:hypothetical protein